MKFTKDEVQKAMLLYAVTDRSWLKEIPHSKSFLACLKDFSSYKLTPKIFRAR